MLSDGWVEPDPSAAAVAAVVVAPADVDVASDEEGAGATLSLPKCWGLSLLRPLSRGGAGVRALC